MTHDGHQTKQQHAVKCERGYEESDADYKQNNWPRRRSGRIKKKP